MIRPVDFRDVLRDICRTAERSIVEALHAERLHAKAKPLTQVEQPILDMFVRLQAADVRLGLISNCSSEEVAAWEQSPLAALIEAPVFSYQVGLVKPDPRIYALACRRLGVAPENAAFVGDGGSDELAGAAASWMRAYRAGWFLRRWPAGRSPAMAGFPRLDSPANLLDTLL